MRISRILFRTPLFSNIFRCCNILANKLSTVKVLSLDDDDSLRIFFKVHSTQNLSIKAPKHEEIHKVLSKIKLLSAIQRKKEEIKQSVIKKYSGTTQVEEEIVGDAMDDVYLIKDDTLMNNQTSNIDAWSQASVLKIGDMTFAVEFNVPTVLNLTLPDYILRGCILRPHFLLECASLKDCIFTWYHSQPIDLNNLSDICDKADELEWTKVHEGFLYKITNDDVNCFLKVVCSPRQGCKVGKDSIAISKCIVEAGPEYFPFEERHEYTKAVSDSDSIRCVSYNTLANMYVEKRKFPYTSAKARDVYYRKQLLFKELLGYNSDIICLQEIQDRVYEYDCEPILNQFGFQGFYMRKGGHRYEGLATFFRSSKFKVIFYKGVLLNTIVKEKDIVGDLLTKISGNYKDMSKMLAQDTALQALILENNEHPQNKILVANTHLYSNKNTPEVRLFQSVLSVLYLEYLTKTHPMLADSKNIIFCGDFNSLPGSEVFSFITSGSFECCPSWKNNSNSSSDADTIHHNLQLDSGCGTPIYTNYTHEFNGCLDYIFYSKNSLEVTQVVPMPSHEEVTKQDGLPSEYFPSDHLALVCTFKWKKKS